MPQRSMPITNTKQVLPGLVVDVGEGYVCVLVDLVGVAGRVAFLKISLRVPKLETLGTFVL